MLQSMVSRFACIGVDPLDSEGLRLKKTLLLGIATMIALAGAFWGIVYAFFGEFVTAAIPLSYAVISSLSIVTFALTRRYHFFRTSQLLLMSFLIIRPEAPSVCRWRNRRWR
jgi:guanylate cyclase